MGTGVIGKTLSLTAKSLLKDHTKSSLSSPVAYSANANSNVIIEKSDLGQIIVTPQVDKTTETLSFIMANSGTNSKQVVAKSNNHSMAIQRQCESEKLSQQQKHYQCNSSRLGRRQDFVSTCNTGNTSSGVIALYNCSSAGGDGGESSTNSSNTVASDLATHCSLLTPVKISAQPPHLVAAIALSEMASSVIRRLVSNLHAVLISLGLC